MKTFLRSKYLLIGTLVGLLAGGGWLAWAAIQSEVGVNIFAPTNGNWFKWCARIDDTIDNAPLAAVNFSCTWPEIQSLPYLLNPAGNYDRTKGSVTSDGLTTTGFPASVQLGFNGTTFDRIRSVIGSADTLAATSVPAAGVLVYNGTTFDRWRSALQASGGIGTGIPGVGLMLNNAGVFSLQSNAQSLADGVAGGSIATTVKSIFNGTTFDRQRSASTTNLATSPLTGVSLTLTASNASCTSTPGAGAQATCTLAAGAGTVRHVATTITACVSDSAALAALTVNLRDGATGAGTVKWSALLGVLAGDSKCVNISGLSITGSATTAMTLEFAAAGAATTLESVTLTALNVQ